jgi:hypothetical protein
MSGPGHALADMDWPERLRDLARRVERNVPNGGDPERFHVDKSEIADDLRRIAQEAEYGPTQDRS